MRPKLALAAGFFLFWLCVLYAGADHPPPLGFLWVVLLDLAATLLVYVRIPTYADWQAARRPRRLVRVLRDGALTGLAFGATTMAFSVMWSGNALELGWAPVLTWCVVLTLVGVMSAALLYALIALTVRAPAVGHRGSRAQPHGQGRT